MALDASLLDLVSTLDLEKVPDKLHCAACHKFLFNAYKPTCCEQSICEPCFASSYSTCPVCDHTPFTDDVCKPSKAMRGTAKAYLRTVEKTRAEERLKSTSLDNKQLENGSSIAEAQKLDGLEPQSVNMSNGIQRSIEGSQERHLEDSDQVFEKFEARSERHPSDTTDMMEEEVEIQVEPLNEDDDAAAGFAMQTAEFEQDQYEDFHTGGLNSHINGKREESANEMHDNNFGNMLHNGFNNMDYSQMMQQMMSVNGMNGFQAMMGMPLGMNSMSGLFSGFGGPNGGLNGMNGMNMGMDFNQNQGLGGVWNNQNNNNWQNNNTNPFFNGMGGDFNSNFGMNMSQGANSHQQQYPNGDFQTNYHGRNFGRGRGRGRGGYGRSRGSFNHHSQNQQPSFQNMHEHQPMDYRNARAQNMPELQDQRKKETFPVEDLQPEDDEFAPGGQDEVQEALGNEYDKVNTDTVSDADKIDIKVEAIPELAVPMLSVEQQKLSSPLNGITHVRESSIEPGKEPQQEDNDATSQNLIPEAYGDDIVETPNIPFSAPLGPSAEYRDHARDHGFRSRGHARFSSRGRGTSSVLNGHLPSPVKPALQVLSMSPPQTKGAGIVGAPTGPRAMREPSHHHTTPRPTSTGFQIVGRAALTSQKTPSHSKDSYQSPSPAEDHSSRNHESSPTKRLRRQEPRRSDEDEADGNDNGDRDHSIDHQAREHDRDRKYRKPRQDEPDDYEMENRDRSYSRTNSIDRKTSRRSRGEKERYQNGSRHHEHQHQRHSSRSHKRSEEAMNDEYADSPRKSNRDDVEPEGWDSYRNDRNIKDSKHDERTREDKYRDRGQDRDRERNRKRSRHDRDREDGDQEDDYDYNHKNGHDHSQKSQSTNNHHRHRHNNNGIDDDEDNDQDTRHRSRRHKKNNHHDSQHRVSHSTTPQTQKHSRSDEIEPEKDPHTLEREARNRERMLKEQQRREKAANNADKRILGSANSSGTRRVSYKYEDEAERGMVENERLTARWR